MSKKLYSFFLLLTALLCLGTGTMWGTETISPESPYTNGFESGMPSGWTHTGSGGDASVESKQDISVRTGNRALKLQVNKGKNYRVVLPEFSDDIQYLTVSFYCKQGSNKASFSLGYDKSGTYTQVSTFTPSTSSYGLVSYTFTSSVPSGALIAIQITSGETSGTRKSTAYIDDVTVTTSNEGSSCAASGVPSASEVTAHSAKLTWTAASEVENYQFSCVRKGLDPVYGPAQSVLTVTIDTLAAETEYDFYVRSYCGSGEGEQGTAKKVTFETEVACVAPTALGVSDVAVNSAVISWGSSASKWNLQYQVYGDENWTTVAVTENPYTLSSLTNGTKYNVRVQTDCESEGTSAWTATESFSTEICAAEDKKEISYELTDAYGDGWNGATLSIVHNTSQATVATLNLASGSSASGSVALCCGETYSFVWAKGSYDGECGYILKDINDDTILEKEGKTSGGVSPSAGTLIEYTMVCAAPACAAPTALTVSEISTNSAEVTWTSEASEFALEYKKTSDENWTAATGTIASPFVLSGLEANETEYTVRVKAICGETPSGWTVLATPFQTKCEANSLGWSEDFDGLSALPACWAAGAYGSGNGQWNITSDAARFNARTNNNVDLTTPEITLLEEAQLQFTHYNSMTTGSVYVKEGDNEPVLLTNVSTASSATLQKCNLTDYTGKTVKIIFRGHGYNAYTSTYFYLEDVTIVAKPCDAPTALSKEESSSSVVLSWTDDAASKWNLRWREVGAADWNDVENLTENTLTLTTTDLAFDKTYQAQVQAVCSTTKSSDWSDLISFSLVCGAAPTVLTVSDRTAEGATLTWTGAENAFLLQTSQDNDTWSDAIAVNDHTYALTGLNAGTTYYARVQNACGGDFAITSFKTWCGLQDAAELPLNVTSFSNPLPACWEVTFKGEWSGISGNNICFYGTEEQWVVLPAYDIDLNKLSVTFTFTTSSATATFGYLDAPNGEFHAFASQPTSGVELDLAAEASAPKYIAVRYNGGSGDYNYVQISAISIRKTPTCLKPGTPSVTPGVGAATISWTEGGSETAWNLQYKLASTASWTDAEGTITNPFVLSGLEQGVSYKVRVQANCGEELSDWSDEAEFTTNCEDVAALPFIETFDAALSNCWDITDEETSWYAHSVFGGELRLPGGKAASGHLVKLPNITASLTNAAMTIIYKATEGDNTAVPQVGYMNGEDFVQLKALAKSNSSEEDTIQLARANGKRLALRYDDGTSEGNFDITEIRILEQLTLADNVDNTATLAALNGQTVDVTIGRTFVCADYFNTICLPFSLSVAELAASPIASNDLWAFKYARVEGGELLIRIVEAESINAGEPYLISWPAGDNIENPLFKNVTISASVGKVMGDDDLKFVGTLKPETFAAHDDSKLFLYQNNTLYWWNGDAASSLKSFRAFFTVEGGAGDMPIKNLPARIIKEEQETTGIDNTGVDAQALKLLENGCVVIIRNGVKYNIQGQVIEK